MKPLVQVLARREERAGEGVVKEILTRFDVRIGSTVSIVSRASMLRELDCSSVSAGSVTSGGFEKRPLSSLVIQAIARSCICTTPDDSWLIMIGWPLALSVSITRFAKLRLCS